MTIRQQIETKYNIHLTRQWILNGAGPARFGWGVIEPLRVRYLGKTLAEVERKLDECTVPQSQKSNF